MGQERIRIAEEKGGKKSWRLWGPYLAERQWGTVREDYSPYGSAWEYSSHDMARSKAYRWGEEGIGGVCDSSQRLCFALGFWNNKDPIMKERFFGLTGNEGNHGEDVKEYYYYLDNTPTHSYMKMLYKYPHSAFPYACLIAENTRRGKDQIEFELIDTGVFDKDHYLDIFMEYAKADAEDILIRISIHNRGLESAPINILPHLWFRNTWSWNKTKEKPELFAPVDDLIESNHPSLGTYYLYAKRPESVLFCENETNVNRLYGLSQEGYFKDGINDFIVNGNKKAVNPELRGTKAAFNYFFEIKGGSSSEIHLRLSAKKHKNPFEDFDGVFRSRVKEADAFYADVQKGIESEDEKNIQRQALAGMLWSKQYYYYDIREWLEGDPGQPLPPSERRTGRNHEWDHLNNADIISMPDKWEYPWYAAWDLAFHCIPLCQIDPEFAKNQLILMCREWYMHPNGQFPAYEWAFGDVNPPVHAWATWRVFQIDRKLNNGKGDREFLERVFHKLLLNFTWWVNRKDAQGRNLFQGGFLGLDNIGVFDRSAPLPTGGFINQSDGTSWMAMYSLNLMRIALELALENRIYEDIATKFFEHFLHIAEAMTNMAGKKIGLWDEEDEFYYDALNLPDGQVIPLKIRSIVGLIPLFAVEVLEPEILEQLPNFHRRLKWFLKYRPDLANLVSCWETPGRGARRLLSLVRGSRMKKLLQKALDEKEFLSDYGIRALSKYHETNPFICEANGMRNIVQYKPAESDTTMFGGNSNWRGPIWFPLNYLLIESLQKFHHYYGDEFKIECPTGSGNFVTILDAANDLSKRLINIFVKDEAGKRPVFNQYEKFQTDPHFRDHILFHEYFHGDNGRGVGASHQTGWTGVVAKLIQPRAKPH